MAGPAAPQLVVFSLGSGEYALPIAAVHEIIRYTEPRTVAAGAAWVRGVIALRGKIIPVFDLAARLRLDAAAAEPGKIIIVERGSGHAGVVVDDVVEVLTVAREQLEEVPTADGDAIGAIARLGDRLVIVLDPVRLFARADADDLAAA